MGRFLVGICIHDNCWVRTLFVALAYIFNLMVVYSEKLLFIVEGGDLIVA